MSLKKTACDGTSGAKPPAGKAPLGKVVYAIEDIHRRASNPFWKFSLKVYRADGVEAACLALQGALGVDVNVLFFCCWAGELGIPPLSDQSMRRALKAVESWQTEVVWPLRAARRRIKQGVEGVPQAWAGRLRKAIGAAELDAEYVEQIILNDLVSLGRVSACPPQKCRAAAVANLARYFRLAGVHPGKADQRHVETILAACFQPE